MSHALVVGGTGMLRGASMHLASEWKTVSVVARRGSGLKSLQEAARPVGGSINPVQVDYRDDSALAEKIGQAAETFGPVTLAVCWIHSIAENAPFVIAEAIANPLTSRYFDIWGSESAKFSALHRLRELRLQKFKEILYRKIILGSVTEGGHSRWLTNHEISVGVIEAVRSDRRSAVVGFVNPHNIGR